MSRSNAPSSAASTVRAQRAGMTLTELLVVVSIIVVLIGLMVPMMQPVLRGQKIREASRQVNVFLTGAQAKAMELGRPVGVWLERADHEYPPATGPVSQPNLWYTVYTLYQAEQPEPYTGDVMNGLVYLRRHPVNPYIYYAGYARTFVEPNLTIGIVDCCPTLHNEALILNQLTSGNPVPRMPLIQRGDRIRFEQDGPDYAVDSYDQFKITFVVDDPKLVFLDPNNASAPPRIPSLERYLYATPPPGADHNAGLPMSSVYQPGVRFEIIRQPIKTATTPIVLPRNTAIDLSLSGFQSVDDISYFSLTRFRDAKQVGNPPWILSQEGIAPVYDIVIMFHPNGGVDRVHYMLHELPVTGTSVTFWPWSEPPTGRISLFVTRDDQIGRDGQQGTPQLNVGQSHFVNSQGPLGAASLTDADNIWLTIDSQSGQVRSAPNVNPFGSAVGSLPLKANIDVRRFLRDARTLADTGLDQGGR